MSVPEQTPARTHKTTRFLLTGLATLLPVVVTGYIIYLLYEFVDKNLGQWITLALARLLAPLMEGLTGNNPG
ncbi:MAG: hypothetical protein ACODAJ_17085, partial [Planctomycetota bacterium]